MQLRIRHGRRLLPGLLPGFTLVELLVVIAIVAVLAGIAVAVYTGTVTIAREKRTQGTLKKIDTLVSQRAQAIDRQLDRGLLDKLLPNWKAKGFTQEGAKVVVRKMAMRQYLPQNFGEAGSLAAGSGHTAATESAEALYWALTEGPSIGGATTGADTFDSNEVRDTDGDGLMEFVDGWGNPIRFYRWPTRVVRPGGGPIDGDFARLLMPGMRNAVLGADPDDPKNLAQTTEPEWHLDDTYHAPLLVSAGQDGDLGLYEPTDGANGGTWGEPKDTSLGGPVSDNFTNLNAQGNN